MGIEILYKKEEGFAPFLRAVAGKRVAILYDVNTAPYAEEIRKMLKGAGCLIANVPYRDAQLLPTEDKWFGVTYREDKDKVVGSLRALIESGFYPEKLFG